jgi:hypothetical protein
MRALAGSFLPDSKMQHLTLRRNESMKRISLFAFAALLFAGAQLHAQAAQDTSKKAVKAAAKTADKAATGAKAAAKSAEKSAATASSDAKTATKAAAKADTAAGMTPKKKSSTKKHSAKKSSMSKDSTAKKP